MTKLCQEMIRAMEIKNLSANTQRAYLTTVTGLSKHYQKSPVKITDKMIEDYLLYLKNDKGSADYILRKKPRKLPTVSVSS